MTIAECLTGGVEIRLRMIGGPVAPGEAEHGGKRDGQEAFVVYHES
jgi:hypothetical protein